MIGVLRGLIAAAAASAATLLPGCASDSSMSAYRSLVLKSLSPPPEGVVRVRFMGTSTILLEDQQTRILTDGFFTRPSLPKVATEMLEPDIGRIRDALQRAEADRIAAIFVAHSHYDHALDSADVAKETGATVYGSQSTLNIAAGRPFKVPLELIEGGGEVPVNGFHVKVFRAEHSSPQRYSGSITAPLKLPAWASDFQEGASFSFLVTYGNLRILIHPSANFIAGMFRGVEADVVFLGTAYLATQEDDRPGFAKAYWCELVERTGAKLVIPIHWDDFFVPLDQPLRPLPRNTGSFDETMALIHKEAAASGVAIRLMPLFDPVDFPLQDPSLTPDTPVRPRKAGDACPWAKG
ncbi:MBL fold metallo-hydrolase [Dongia sedimenti]|uniref:MBL fold metallo-hydrolase n=1 Tax=Dongia sedimenti TaxID=3064282 RepID=A0ABU0YGN0_9PROT|nr:MBL fold metallo-hydrolase [Rhodospirillaceae bacterium R-7]